MIGSIVIVGDLTRYALLRFVCSLKVAQMNVQSSLIQEFELGHNVAKLWILKYFFNTLSITDM